MIRIVNVITEMLGKEVFVLASDETYHAATCVSRQFFIFDSIEDLRDKLSEISANEADDLKLVHGVLSSASVLPLDFDDRTAYVIVANPLEDEDCFLVEGGDTTKHIEEEVTDVMKFGIGDFFHAGIEDVFVLYGYEIPIGLGVPDDELDEEIIDSCLKVAHDVNELEQLALKEKRS